MKIPIEPELRKICVQIESEGLTVQQWAEIESDDQFQMGQYVGGFDADEGAFCFTHVSSDQTEHWFQFSLETALAIANDASVVLMGQTPE